MSKRVAGGYEKEKVLRRSRRTKKVRTPIVSESSGTESVDSESETVKSWSLSGKESDLESFGDFSEVSH